MGSSTPKRARARRRRALSVAVGVLILIPTGTSARQPSTCGGESVAILGTEAADLLVGTPGTDVIAAGSGDDVVLGLEGADRICGGRGDDRLRGGGGRDLLFGGPGDDVALGGPGGDRIRGGPGRDTAVGGLIGGGGPDTVHGGQGSDRLTDGPGKDRLLGGRGPDMLIPSAHPEGDLLDGQAGRDLVFYLHVPRGVRVHLALGVAEGYGNDRLRRIEDAEGARFDDVLIGDAGPNELLGAEGDDRILGRGDPICSTGSPARTISEAVPAEIAASTASDIAVVR